MRVKVGDELTDLPSMSFPMKQELKALLAELNDVHQDITQAIVSWLEQATVERVVNEAALDSFYRVEPFKAVIVNSERALMYQLQLLVDELDYTLDEVVSDRILSVVGSGPRFSCEMLVGASCKEADDWDTLLSKRCDFASLQPLSYEPLFLLDVTNTNMHSVQEPQFLRYSPGFTLEKHAVYISSERLPLLRDSLDDALDSVLPVASNQKPSTTKDSIRIRFNGNDQRAGQDVVYSRASSDVHWELETSNAHTSIPRRAIICAQASLPIRTAKIHITLK